MRTADQIAVMATNGRILARVKPEHKATYDQFVQIGEEVYRVNTRSPLSTGGINMDKRWECSISHWNHFARKVFGDFVTFSE